MIMYFLPILSAMMYGYYYSSLGRTLQVINIPTMFFYSSVFGLLFSGLYGLFNKQAIDLYQPFQDKTIMALMFSGLTVSWCAWLFTTSVIKNISPTYAAIGEVAYPIFVPLFAYLLFREKQWDLSTLIGGGLIFLGLFILIFVKSRG